MTLKVVVVVLGVLATLYGSNASTAFPDGFIFGTSTSAYQVEGAWNVSDKGESIMDRFIHTHGTFNASVAGANGDIACDSYHLWERDVNMTAELGLDFYRFSISWSRLLPNGFANNISDDGKAYYNNLIDGLLAKGVEPCVTLYHFDLPEILQDLGGWTNPKIADWYADYARVAFNLFGDRVKTWLTINEPVIMCDLAYGLGVRAPGIIETQVAPYLCAKNVILAHAKAYRIYDENFRSTYNGSVSIVQEMPWYEPYSSEYQNLTDLATEYFIDRFLHPIYSEAGGWPSSLETYMSELSTEEGYSFSRLPAFTDEEITLAQGTYDFLAINHYTSRLVRKADDGESVETSVNSGIKEMGAIFEVNSSWPVGANPSFPIYPEGLRKRMAWVKEKYGNISILITETGYSTNATNPDDESRITFIRNSLEQVLLSINEDSVDVKGFSYWSLMDNIRLANGNTLPYKFGLYEVDYSSSELTRTARGSAEYYKRIIQNRTLDV